MNKVKDYVEKYEQLIKINSTLLFIDKLPQIEDEMDKIWHSMTELEREAVRTIVSRYSV